MLLRVILFFLAFSAACPLAWAQTEFTNIEAETLEQLEINGQKVRKFEGNVVIQPPGQTITAKTALQYIEKNRTVLLGGVRIDQGNGQVITSDSLVIEGPNRIAKLRGNVFYNENGTRTLATDALNYNLKTGDAQYFTGGTINDNGTLLKSRRGNYNKQTGKMNFRGDVQLNGSEFTLNTDSLDYNANTKKADFFGPTTIVNNQGTIVSTGGSYNTTTGQALFSGRSNIDSPDYTLTGDIVNFDRATGNGFARGNVRLFTKSDSVIITGDRGYYAKPTRTARIFGNTLVKTPGERKSTAPPDTLYIRSDSIRAITDKADTSQRRVISEGNVRLYNQDFQAVADSLVYGTADSTITFYQDPVLWSGKNQLSGDTIIIRLENNRIDSLLLIRNAFIINQDTMSNYNQVKGRYVRADFEGNKMKKALVIGNAQSLFFAVDENTNTLQGMNRIICSRMIIRFDSTNKPKTITAITKPEAAFIPPHELAGPDKKLKGFAWIEKGRPTLQSVLFPLGKTPPKPAAKSKKKPAKKNKSGSKKNKKTKTLK